MSRSHLRAVLFGIAALASIGAAVPAASYAASYCEWTYYSDATYTTIVGERIKTCQGQVYSSGIVTTFKLGGCEPCGGGRLAATSVAAAEPFLAPLAKTHDEGEGDR